MKNISINHKYYYWGALSIFTLIILFFISPDSYTHDLCNRVDSAIFFMSGKAWMNGMIPYVDFADSKGPLLWLIYGVAYLISPHNYIGVFWISYIFWSFTYWYIYKISHLFIHDNKLSFLCTIAISLSFFNPWFHYETRAEDFCQLFIAMSLFYACKILYGNYSNYKKSYLFFGICFASVLLIKYNIALMILIFPFYTFFHKGNYKSKILYFTIGTLVIITPFCINFIISNNIFEFINEYFLITLQTINNSDRVPYKTELIRIFIDPARTSLLFINLLGCILFIRSNSKLYHKLFPTITFLFFFFISNIHYFKYYVTVCSIFTIWLIIFIVRTIKPQKVSCIIATTIIPFYIIFTNLYSCGYMRPNFFLSSSPNRNNYYKADSILKTKNNPTIICIGADIGLGTPSNALPGCKYWTLQVGATQQMLESERQSIKNSTADFIIINRWDNNKRFNITDKELKEYGYIPLDSIIIAEKEYWDKRIIFGKQNR